MAFNNLLCHFICFFLFLSLFQGKKQVVAEGSTSRNQIGFRPKKLFVFGDSYADTGNNPISSSTSWKFPYGITFPGKPAGRYSDGRVFTDYFAKFLEIKTPIAYRWRNVWGRSHLKYGMNFAAGGTGVFDTTSPGPNMTTQIDFFQGVLASGGYTKRELSSSVAHVSVTGNDHTTYIRRNGSAQGFPSFIRKVVNQVEVNLKRIHGLGVKKVVVTALQPLGCLPRSLIINKSFPQCNATQNALSLLHNHYLHQAVAKVNAESNNTSFLILDFHEAFWTVFKRNEVLQGSPTFLNSYEPCCLGTSTGATCGRIDAQGAKMFTVCADPGSRFFFDGIHPSQAGWNAVYSTPAIKNTFKQL